MQGFLRIRIIILVFKKEEGYDKEHK